MYLKGRMMSFVLGLVSFFYWLSVRNVPMFQLVDRNGRPMGGLGILLSIFNEQYLGLITIFVSGAFLIALVTKQYFLGKVIAAVLLGIWMMLGTAYVIYSFVQQTISPNLVLILGYCCATWIELKRNWDD